MIRSILIGLDGSESDIAVEELGIRWARRFGASLTGIAIVDDPGFQFTGDGTIDRTAREPALAACVAEIVGPPWTALRAFSAMCGDAGVDARALEANGSPHAEILREAQRHDLILLGTQSHFEYGWEGHPGQTLSLVLKDCSRPVVAVPESLRNPMSEPSVVQPIVVAFDGSLQASRALYAFEASGLGRSRPVHVLSIDHDPDEANRLVGRAVDYLRSHDLEVFGHPEVTSRPPAEVLLEKVHHLDAELLVMGAYGQPMFREFFIGSVTRTVLEKSSAPVFCYH